MNNNLHDLLAALFAEHPELRALAVLPDVDERDELEADDG